MRILLAGPDHEENLPIRYLSGSLRSAGHDTVLAAFNTGADADAVANAAQDADLVGLSLCFQARAGEFLHLARRIKSCDPGKPVVAGGHYASCAAEPLLANHPELDAVVIHEGERTLVEIADALPQFRDRLPEIAGIAYRDGGRVRFTTPRPTLEDLDALPFPDRRGPVYPIAGVPTSYLLGSRGCYENCAYCCITTLHRMAPGKRFRQRRVERVADEMAALYHERGTRQFIFHDDNFLVPSEAANNARVSAFEKALGERGVNDIALVIKCRPADANRKVLRRLKDLGLVRVFLGVESASTRGLSILERNQSVEDSERALEACAELDISAQYTLMIFHPDTTLGTLRADAAFLHRFSANPLNFCRTEIYAGTPLEKRMIALGRAHGNYLARVYDLPDPVARLACDAALELFQFRCWSNGSLMQNAIGLDHMAAVLKRFYQGPQSAALGRRVADWVRSANSDTIRLLDELIELTASAGGRADGRYRSGLRTLTEREAGHRKAFLADAAVLRADLGALRVVSGRPGPSSWSKVAKQAAAAVLALGLPVTAINQHAIAQQGQAAPPASAAGQDKGVCSLRGVITDPAGAVVVNARVTITNTDTGAVRNLTTDQSGLYAANELPAGRYTIRVESPGFRAAERTGIRVRAGERIDVALMVEVGSCEYVAVPLQAPPKVTGDLRQMKKPFTYVVGDAADNGTFRGIASLVYGDSRDWIQIFEANRKMILKPGSIPEGTPILIPPRKRLVPELVHRVAPVYPPAARTKRVWGDVVLDVTLREDGTVAAASVVDGDPLLAGAATGAVQQWRYRPLAVQGAPVLKFIVVVSFEKNGRVR